MKYTVSYSRKVRAGQRYESLDIFASVESDTAIEPMEAAYNRVKAFVENHLDSERERLLEKAVKRPEAE